MIYDIGNIEFNILKNEEKIIVRVPGSDGFDAIKDENDWLKTNFRFWPVQVKRKYNSNRGIMHAGFAEAGHIIYEKVLGFIENEEIQFIELSGHSMGAAAAIAAGWFLSNDGIKCEVIAHASPRVFGWFTKIPNKLHIIRRVYGKDFIVNVPPVWMGYKHVGNLEYIESTGIKINEKLPNIFDDHYPQHYGLDWSWWK